MADVKTWRLLLDGNSRATEPLGANEIAERIWSESASLWAEPTQPGEAAFPQDIPEVRSILLANPERVARAWLKHAAADTVEWMFVWVVELFQQHPDEAWPLLLSLVDLARDDKELAMVAAGPLEELLVAQGARVIDRVEVQAARDAKFRRALSGIWRSEITEGVWERVLAARGTEPGLDQ